MFECCLVISYSQDKDAAQVANNPHNANAGHQDQLQKILDPTDFKITLASALATTFRIGNMELYVWKITDVDNQKFSHSNFSVAKATLQ